MTTIKMTPEELRTTASDLISQKDQVFDIMSQMNSKIEALDWQGTAQQKFHDLWRETYDGVHKMMDESVNGISEALKGAAQTLEEVDNSLF